MILDIITKSQDKICIEKIKELYFEGINENETIPENQNTIFSFGLVVCLQNGQ